MHFSLYLLFYVYYYYYFTSIILLGFRYSASSIPLISLAGVAIGVGLTLSILILVSLWIYSGFTWINLTLDNSNIGFNLPIIILFPIINWIAESETKSNQYIIDIKSLNNRWHEYKSYHQLDQF